MRVTDASDGKPVPFCHICIEHLAPPDKAYFVGDINGKASVELHGNEIVSVTAIGYRAYFDTLTSVSDELTISLEYDRYNLEEVVVTGQFKPVSRDQSIYNIEFIGKNEIESRAASTLSELLSNKINFKINNDASLGSSLELSGISGENIKILIDGIPVIGRLNGNIDLSQINLSDVDHIEIIEGPMSVMYGSNALGGVINIITRDNKYAKFRGDINSYYEMVGTYNLNARANVKIGKGNIGISGGRNFFDGHSLGNTLRFMEWKPKEQYNARVIYWYNAEKFKFRYKTDFFRETLLYRNEPIPPYFEKAFDAWYYTIRYNNDIQVDKVFSEMSNASLLIGYSFYEREREFSLKDLTTQVIIASYLPEVQNFNAVTGRGIYSHSLLEGLLSVNTGFDINYETGTGARIKTGKEDIGDYALFTSLQFKPHSRWTFQPALRVSHNTKYDSPVIPSFNVKYSAGSGSLRVSYARGFRAPSLKELYLDFYDSNHKLDGNENLVAERSHHFNLDLNCNPTIAGRTFDLEAKTFYNSIKDKIDLVQVDIDDPLHYRNENVGYFESVGGNFNISLDPWKIVSLTAGVGTIGKKEDQFESDRFIFSANASTDLSIRLFRNTTLFSLYYKYSGEESFHVTDGENIQLYYIEPYHSMDLTLLVKLFRQSLHFSTGVKNLFDNTVIPGLAEIGSGHGTSTVSPLVGWGRTYFVGVNYNFVKY